MSIKVNGINYGWGDVDVKLPGLNLVVQEISYDDEQEMEESYGRGYRPRGYGKGNYKSSGKVSMLRDDYDDVLDYCKATGTPFYGVELPSVVVSYGNPGGRTRIDELKRESARWRQQAMHDYLTGLYNRLTHTAPSQLIREKRRY